MMVGGLGWLRAAERAKNSCFYFSLRSLKVNHHLADPTYTWKSRMVRLWET